MKQLSIESVRLNELTHDPANLNLHDERSLSSITASLRRFGQQKPIVVDSQNVVRAGNGTLAAARDLGWESLDVVRTDLTGSDVVAYAIADNRTSEMSHWDEEPLAAMLTALAKESDELFASTGFTSDELEKLLGEDAIAPDEFDEFDTGIETEHECPKCGYKWS